MRTYQIHERRLVFSKPHASITFPAVATLRLLLAPSEIFGVGEGSCTYGEVGSQAQLHPDFDTGRAALIPLVRLPPMQMTVTREGDTIRVDGTELIVTRTIAALSELAGMVGTYVYVLPGLLSLEFIDAIHVLQVSGEVGAAGFRYEVVQMDTPVGTVPKGGMERKVESAIARLDTVKPDRNRRLLAATIYFHIGVRLLTAGYTAFEFLGEALLNFAKVLDALFVTGEESSRDQMRNGLRQLGYSNEEAEGWFMPTVALRNQFDVAHISLTPLSREQLDVLYRYCRRAQPAFSGLLSRTANAVQAGSLELPPYVGGTLSGKKLQVIDRIARSLVEVSDPPW